MMTNALPKEERKSSFKIVLYGNAGDFDQQSKLPPTPGSLSLLSFGKNSF